MPRLVFTVNNIEFLRSHRSVLVRGALDAGYDVHVVGPAGPGVAWLTSLSVPFHQWNLDRKGQRLDHEAKSLAALVTIYRDLTPDLVHHVTIKPVLYGSAAARLAGGPGVINAVSGLGYLFLANGPVAVARRAAVAAAYRFALSTPNSRVVLQNDDDEFELRRLHALGRAQVVKIRGSGLDLQQFQETPIPTGKPVVVLPARLLRDKGVVEFAQAAAVVRRARPDARMVLVGGLDDGNPAGVRHEEVAAWVADGVLEWWGHRTDMVDVLKQATVVTLPSYREGLPRALMEAAAIGRPIVTTDAPGCRDAVDGGRCGLLVPLRDSHALAQAILSVINDPNLASRLATDASHFARKNFDQREVLRQHLDIYEELRRARS